MRPLALTLLPSPGMGRVAGRPGEVERAYPSPAFRASSPARGEVKRKKALAVWDIDGTIFRSSLTIELFRRLVARGIFPPRALVSVRRSEQKWLDRQGSYHDYIWDVVRAYQKAIVGKRRIDILRACREVIAEQKLRTYRYTRDLLRQIRGKYFTLAISGSPIEVVSEYNKSLKFDKVYGTEFGLDRRGRYTGVVLHEPPQYKQELIVRYAENHGFSFKNSIGVGDTESDIGFLNLVHRPIAFNPNTLLAAHAKKKNWNIVIERKDLVVEFKPKTVRFLKV